MSNWWKYQAQSKRPRSLCWMVCNLRTTGRLRKLPKIAVLRRIPWAELQLFCCPFGSFTLYYDVEIIPKYESLTKDPRFSLFQSVECLNCELHFFWLLTAYLRIAFSESAMDSQGLIPQRINHWSVVSLILLFKWSEKSAHLYGIRLAC